MSEQTNTERIDLIDAGRDLTRADYYLASAATTLERTSRHGWREQSDGLFKQVLALRQAIQDEVGS